MAIIPALNQDQVMDWYQTYVMRTYGRVPIVFERGEGAYLWDTEREALPRFRQRRARRHRPGPPAPEGAPGDARADGAPAVPLERLPSSAGRGARRGCSRSAAAGVSAFFCNSGTEASETAIKLARKWGHTHGGAGQARDHHLRARLPRADDGRDLRHRPDEVPAGLRAGAPRLQIRAVQRSGGAESRHQPGDRAIFVEPVQGESGIYPATPEFMQGARRAVREEPVLFMVDEVQTGFGRTGKFWAYEHYGVEPDVVPPRRRSPAASRSAPVSRSRSAPPSFPATMAAPSAATRSPRAAAVGALLALDEGGYIENAARQGAALKQRLQKLVPEKLAEVRGLGLMIGVDLKEPKAKAVFDACLAAASSSTRSATPSSASCRPSS